MAGFLAQGTSIKLIDGNEQLVEQLHVDDDILTYDFESNRVIFAKIVRIEKKESSQGIRIRALDYEITCSPETEFFTESTSTGIVAAKDIKEGDTVLYFDLFSPVVGTVETVEKRTEPHTFYALTISDYGNVIGNNLVMKC